MKYKTDDQIDRHPWQVEQGNGSDSGKKAPHRVQIANRLSAFTLAADLERQSHDGIVDPHAHRFIEAVADTDQDTAADDIDDALSAVQTHHQDKQRYQRRNTAARQDAIINFEHEKRARENKNVAHAAEKRDGEEG